METKAPTFLNTRWESMTEVLHCFESNHVEVLSHVDPKKLSSGPSSLSWIVAIFIHNISAGATITLRSLEGLTTIVSQKREGLKHLHCVFALSFNAAVPLSDKEAEALDV